MTSGRLDAALAELLVRCGAQVARAVDGRTGTVLGEAGTAAGDDVSALVRLAAEAGSAAADGGGLDDLVLATRRSVHVLRRAASPGSFLHVRLDAGRGDLAAARRELTRAALHGAVRAAASDTDAVAPLPAVPGSAAGQPALAALAPAASARTGSGERAALALGPEPPRPRRTSDGPPAQRSLPRRIPAQSVPEVPPRPVADTPSAAAPPVLRQAWASDTETLRRLLSGLRRPSR